ncbi:hypothetical protein Taro_013639 [Colocasia esculenta]|uniref:Uncharacterized protein n=1 Tax=Colocasia esculenta TaxID=4460 RepID=A0A843UMQ7_COLES|nr:hypothetical protein [Colocasia esculenta]
MGDKMYPRSSYPKHEPSVKPREGDKFFCFSSRKKTLMARNSSSIGSSKVLKTLIASNLGANCQDGAFFRIRLEYSGVLEVQKCVSMALPKAKWIGGFLLTPLAGEGMVQVNITDWCMSTAIRWLSKATGHPEPNPGIWSLFVDMP